MTSKEPPIKHLPGEGQKCQVNCHVKKNKAEDNIKKKSLWRNDKQTGH